LVELELAGWQGPGEHTTGAEAAHDRVQSLGLHGMGRGVKARKAGAMRRMGGRLRPGHRKLTIPNVTHDTACFALPLRRHHRLCEKAAPE